MQIPVEQAVYVLWQMFFRNGQKWKASKPVKKISLNTVSKDTLESSVSEYICVVKKNIVTIRNVQQSHICPGVFVYLNFF